jgi:hypothetical protein
MSGRIQKGRHILGREKSRKNVESPEMVKVSSVLGEIIATGSLTVGYLLTNNFCIQNYNKIRI